MLIPYADELNYCSPDCHRTHLNVSDVLCLVLFLVFLGGWGVVAYLGFQGGDIIRVLYPTNSQVDSSTPSYLGFQAVDIIRVL